MVAPDDVATSPTDSVATIIPQEFVPDADYEMVPEELVDQKMTAEELLEQKKGNYNDNKKEMTTEELLKQKKGSYNDNKKEMTTEELLKKKKAATMTTRSQ